MSETSSETQAEYSIGPNIEDEIISRALGILDSRIKRGDVLSSPPDVRNYMRLQLAGEESEVFCCLFLDSKHRAIDFNQMFKGTIDGCDVYIREVVKLALKKNAAAIIFAHNHPSGDSEPSHADVQVTKRLKQALELVDVRTLDHIVVGDEVVSFAERGLI